MLPVLPLRDIVVFPHMIVPLFVGREKSVRALEEVMTRRQADPAGRRRRTPRRTIPSTDDIYRRRHAGHGAAAAEAARRHGEGAGRGRAARARIAGFTETDDFFEADRRARCRTTAATPTRDSRRWRARWSTQFEQYVKLNKKIAARGAGLDQPDRGAVASWPTRSPRISTLKIAEKQDAAGDRRRRASGWRRCFAHDGGRDRRPAGREAASAAASSGRWRRRSASTTSTSR
jgi:ATP-dependent Lon protease